MARIYEDSPSVQTNSGRYAAQRRTHTRGRPRLDRRDLLRGLGAIAGGVVLAALLDRIDGSRLATGSRLVAARTFPVTSWTFDAVMLFSGLFGLLTASISVNEEIEGRTAITVISKPVSRRQFFIGKYLGILLACCAQCFNFH